MGLNYQERAAKSRMKRAVDVFMKRLERFLTLTMLEESDIVSIAARILNDSPRLYFVINGQTIPFAPLGVMSIQSAWDASRGESERFFIQYILNIVDDALKNESDECLFCSVDNYVIIHPSNLDDSIIL